MALVTTAVVPVAGLGTRLLPATKSQPKEMLPVGGKPVVQHVVEELAAAGIERIVFVTGRGKGAIEDHFDRDPMLTAELERRGDPELLARLGFEQMGVSFSYTRQPSPRGLGDAILGTRDGPPVIARLAAALEQHGAGCAIAVRDVPRSQTGRYGIVSTDDDDGDDDDGGGGVALVSAIVEKPDPAAAPSTLAVAARYVMTPAIFAALRETPPAVNGEVELTHAIARLIAHGTPVVAVRLGDVERHDVGTHESYAAAFLAFALTDPAHGQRMRALARALLAAHDGER